MNTNKDNDFDSTVEAYFNLLQFTYEVQISKADNKKYARAHFRLILFEKHPKLPRDSFFFDMLSKLFLHNYRLKRDSALINTFDQLYIIRERAELELSLLEEIYYESQEGSHALIQSNDIEKEYYLLSLDWHELTDLLALFLATRKLMVTYPKDETVNLYGLNEPLNDKTSYLKALPKKDHNHSFTRNQQLLAVYYLLMASEIKPRKSADITKYAELVNLIMGIPFTSIQNTDTYKKLKKAPLFLKDKFLLENLIFVQEYFKKANFSRAVDLIEIEIARTKRELQ